VQQKLDCPASKSPNSRKSPTNRRAALAALLLRDQSAHQLAAQSRDFQRETGKQLQAALTRPQQREIADLIGAPHLATVGIGNSPASIPPAFLLDWLVSLHTFSRYSGRGPVDRGAVWTN